MELPSGSAETQNVPAYPKQPVLPGSWSTGLFDCFDDVSNCFKTCFCPCITFGQIAEIVDKGSTSCCASGAIYVVKNLFANFPCVYSCSYQSKMRQQYMLNGSSCSDLLVHCCCEPCALFQEYRELQTHGFDMDIGWQGNVEIQNIEVTVAPEIQEEMMREMEQYILD